MLRLALLMVAFMRTFVAVASEIYRHTYKRTSQYELTAEQIEDAHRRAYGKQLELEAAYANYRALEDK